MTAPGSSSIVVTGKALNRDTIGLFAAMAIGIGGMVGAGIFSILGVVAEASGSAMWLSFAIGGLVVLPSTYSYAKLGARYPSAGGSSNSLFRDSGVVC